MLCGYTARLSMLFLTFTGYTMLDRFLALFFPVCEQK